MTRGGIWRRWAKARRTRDEVGRLKVEVKARDFSYTIWHPLFWRCGVGVPPVGLLGFYPFVFYTFWSYLAVWGVIYGVVTLCLLVPPAYRMALSAVPMFYILYVAASAIRNCWYKSTSRPGQRIGAALILLLICAGLEAQLYFYATSTRDHWAISWFWQMWIGSQIFGDLLKWRRPETERLAWWVDCWQGRGYANLF